MGDFNWPLSLYALSRRGLLGGPFAKVAAKPSQPGNMKFYSFYCLAIAWFIFKLGKKRDHFLVMPPKNPNHQPDQLSNNEQQNNLAERITELEKRLDQTITELAEAKEMAQVQKKYQFIFPQIQARAEEWAQLRKQKTTYDEQSEKWWFKLKSPERDQLEKSQDTKQLEQVWQQIRDRRNFGWHLLALAFCLLVFFSWDKFWYWYEKPLRDEWCWDDEAGIEVYTEKKFATPQEPKPQPKNCWERIKDNKMKTVSLIILAGIFGQLLVKINALFL